MTPRQTEQSRKRQRRRAAGFLLGPGLLFSEPIVADANRDIPGWAEARWGMSDAELTDVLGEELETLPGRWEYGNAYATRTIAQVDVGGLVFRAMFQMNEDTERLQQVLMERRREDSNRYTFVEVREILEGQYGPADELCLRPRSAGQGRMAILTWRSPTTTVHATFFDFHSFGLMFRNSRLPVDTYLTGRERKRINRRSLQKKMVIRFHDSDRDDLDRRGPCLDNVPEPDADEN